MKFHCSNKQNTGSRYFLWASGGVYVAAKRSPSFLRVQQRHTFSTVGKLQKPGVQVRKRVIPQAVLFPLPGEGEMSYPSIHIKWPFLSRTVKVKI